MPVYHITPKSRRRNGATHCAKCGKLLNLYNRTCYCGACLRQVTIYQERRRGKA